MKLYVNWYDQELLTKEELDNRIVKMMRDDETFSDFLEAEYTVLEIFEMRDDSRMDFLDEFTDWAVKHTCIGDFTEVEIDIGVPEGAVWLITAK